MIVRVDLLVGGLNGHSLLLANVELLMYPSMQVILYVAPTIQPLPRTIDCPVHGYLHTY